MSDLSECDRDIDINMQAGLGTSVTSLRTGLQP